MEGYTILHSASVSSPSPPIILKSKLLLTCSIINILTMPMIIVRLALLEKPDPFYADPGPASIPMTLFILTGILGFSASYTPKRPLIISALIFSSISMCFALFLSFQLGELCSRKHCTFYESYDTYLHDRKCNALLFDWSLIVVCSINNIIVTVLLSKAICKCCAHPTVSTSIPIATVHNPPVNNLQNLTPTWATPFTGQQPQQFPSSSYPTVVIYSPYQQQPSMNQQEQHQPPIPPSAFFTSNSTEMMNSVTNSSPPPYSTAAAFEPQLSERKLHQSMTEQ